jgi:hypothetical protein
MWAYQIYDETMISGAADDDGKETATQQPDDCLPAGNTRRPCSWLALRLMVGSPSLLKLVLIVMDAANDRTEEAGQERLEKEGKM